LKVYDEEENKYVMSLKKKERKKERKRVEEK